MSNPLQTALDCSHSAAHSNESRAHEHPAGNAREKRALLWALALNGAFLVIEASAGFLTRSLALLSDAAHMANDVGILTLTLFVSCLASRSTSDTNRAKRIELVGAMVSGIALLMASVHIFGSAIERLGDGAPVISGWPVFFVGVIGLAINLGSAWHLHRSGSDSINMRGALLHMLADALGSVGAIVAALFMMAGYAGADTVISLVIATMVLGAAYSLIRDSAHVLVASLSVPSAVPTRIGEVPAT